MWIESTLEYKLYANETNSKGYLTRICYECIVSPISNLSPISFYFDNITIEEHIVDCSSSLSDKGFLGPSPIPFNLQGYP